MVGGDLHDPHKPDLELSFSTTACKCLCFFFGHRLLQRGGLTLQTEKNGHPMTQCSTQCH